jgi:murein DD-endopeptidase MepM/ murein hydrolase activator NlpD
MDLSRYARVSLLNTPGLGLLARALRLLDRALRRGGRWRFGPRLYARLLLLFLARTRLGAVLRSPHGLLLSASPRAGRHPKGSPITLAPTELAAALGKLEEALEEYRKVTWGDYAARAGRAVARLTAGQKRRVTLPDQFNVLKLLRVVAGDYGFDPVLIVPQETLDPATTAAENEMVASIVAVASPERLWEGAFQFPSTGGYTSRFGWRRNYNNMGYTSYHTGLDFAGGTGLPILAPARGRVVFAGPLDVRGNLTFIDHGWGVFTGYLHQSEILVSAGEIVEPGQTIGLVGGTGRVTGPHLHWEVWVGGVPVDPLEWTETVFP